MEILGFHLFEGRKEAAPAAVDTSERSVSPENPQFTLGNPATWVYDIFGGPTPSGIYVDEETAIKFSAVFACVRILSETIASLPFNVYKQTGRSKEVALEHRVQYLIHNEPNTLMTSFVFRETMQACVSLWGNAYAEIIRDRSYRPLSLEIHHPSVVTPKQVTVEGQKMLVYFIKGRTAPVLGLDMIHIPGLSFDGIKGKSPIQVAKDNIGLGLAQEQFGSEFFKNGTAFNGYLKTDAKLSKEQFERALAQWQTRWSGEGNRWKTPLLEGNLDYKTIGIPPEQAQWIASRQFQLSEVTRIFRIPPHLVGDLSRSTNNNIEHQGIEFVVHTMRPWVVRWEQEFNRKLFTAAEVKNHYTKINLDGLLRGDSAARATLYQRGINDGWLSRNEVRELEDRNPVDGLDEYLVPMNMAPQYYKQAKT